MFRSPRLVEVLDTYKSPVHRSPDARRGLHYTQDKSPTLNGKPPMHREIPTTRKVKNRPPKVAFLTGIPGVHPDGSGHMPLPAWVLQCTTCLRPWPIEHQGIR